MLRACLHIATMKPCLKLINKIMYLVKFKTSGIIAYRSLDRVQAQMWALLNDILDADGNPAGLYRIEKLKKPETVKNE